MKTMIAQVCKIPLMIFFISALCTGCSVKLISGYDEITDKLVTELQKKTSTFFEKIKADITTSDADYSNYKAFYQEVRVDLNTLNIRSKAIDKNQITIDQITLLERNINTLEQLHKRGFNNLDEIYPIQVAFNSAYTAMIKLQMAKKLGEKK